MNIQVKVKRKFNAAREALAKIILSKTRRPDIKIHAVALVSPPAPVAPKPKGVKIAAKRKLAPKPKARPKAAIVKAIEPKRKLMPLAIRTKLENTLIAALQSTDKEAAKSKAAFIDARIAARNVKISAYNALSEREKARLEEREENIRLAGDSLVASLPKPSEVGININYSPESILSIIAKTAFCSSLENGILFLADEHFNLSFKIGAQVIKLRLEEKELLDKSVGKLFSWSGCSKVLLNKKREAFSTYDFLRQLGWAARNYQVSQSKLKPLEYYTESLVSKSIVKELEFTGTGSSRKEVIDALSLSIASVAVSLGYHTDKKKSAFFVHSASNRFGTSTVSKKDMLELVKRIVEGSPYYGRLTGKNVPSTINSAVLGMMPL